MDTRIPPDGPRRPASLSNLRMPHEAPLAPPEIEAEHHIDTVETAPLASPVHLTVSSPTLAAPRLTSTQAHVSAVLHPPAVPAEQAALNLLSSIAGTDVVARINSSAQLIAQSALEVSTWHGATAEMSQELFMATRTGLIVGLLNSLEQMLTPSMPESAAFEFKDVQEALADVGAWYSKLDPKKTEGVRVSREDDYTCAISRKSFAEIERPVAVRRGEVAHVFEAEDLLQWMATSMQTPSNHGEATNPVDRTPLHLKQLTRAVNVLYAPVGPARA